MSYIKITKLHNFYTDFIKILENINWKGGDIKTGKHTVSTNINSDTPHSALDFVGNRDSFFDPYDYNSSTNFPNYTADEIIDTYHEVVKKMCESQEGLLLFYNTGYTYTDFDAQENMVSLFNRKENGSIRIVDVLKKMVLPEVTLPLIDIYLSEFLKAPNALNQKHNFLYFIRRFPFVKYLFLDHIKNTSPESIIKLINEFGLEKPSPSNEHTLEYEMNVSSTSKITTPPVTNNFVEEVHTNTFLQYCNNINDIAAIRYNTDLLLTSVDKIEDYVFSFPFLETDDNQLKKIYDETRIMLKDSIGYEERKPVNYFGLYGSLFQGTVIDDAKLIFEHFETELTSSNYITFKYDENYNSNEYFNKQLVIFFSIDMLLSGVSDEISFDNKMLSQYLSMFVIKMYWIHLLLRGKDIDAISDDILSGIKPLREDEISDDVDKYTRNSVWFYLQISKKLFKNTMFRLETKNGIQRMSYLFFVFNFFKTRSKDLFPFFIFAAFSDSEVKYIKNYPTKTNAFLDWLIDLYHIKFPNAITNIV